MFSPVFPINIEELRSLHGSASLIWLSGIVCLWLTRYTHQLGKRWGSFYYALSILVRPAGILLIATGWQELYAPGHYPELAVSDWLPTRSWLDILCWLAIAAFSALGLWGVATLGLRRSFLFRRLDDTLITHGPYALVRHPQFLSVIGITFFGVKLFNLNALSLHDFDGFCYGITLEANWILFTLAGWLLAILEDRELATHFGEVYEEYAQRVPRLLPN